MVKVIFTQYDDFNTNINNYSKINITNHLNNNNSNNSNIVH